MPDLPDDLAGLERRRAELYEQLSQVGDFRRGTLRAVRRKCGRPRRSSPDRSVRLDLGTVLADNDR